MALRVAGTDPGTSSLDVLVLEDGRVSDQVRFEPAQLTTDPTAPVRWLKARGPFDLVAGPSGYGLPLVAGKDCTNAHRRLMTLVRPDDARSAGVAGFSQLVEAFCASPVPVVFLPGVIHLDTVPAHRKHNRIDLGTPDKLCVAALGLMHHGRSFCLVELGSAFTACVVVVNGQIVDGLGGTSGPIGWGSGGAWDGEVAYVLGPLGKKDLFAGGAASPPQPHLLVESVTRAVAGLLAVSPVGAIVLSGRLLETEATLSASLERELLRLGPVERLRSLPGAWVKHAAQGAALIADGLAGGSTASVVQGLRLRQARGTVFDWIAHPRRDILRIHFPGLA